MNLLKNKLTAFSFLTSYLILVIPALLITNMLFYVFFVPSYQKEVEKINKDSLLNIKLLMDNFVTKPLDNLHLDIVSDKYDQGYLYPIYNNPESDVWTIYNTHTFLNKMVSTYPQLLESISIYYTAQEFINSSKGYQFIHKENRNNILQFNWLEHIDFEGQNSWVCSSEYVSYLSTGNENIPVINYMKSIPFVMDSKNRQAVINFSIKSQYLFELINNHMTDNKSNFYIFDKSGTQLYINQPNDKSSFISDELIKNAEEFKNNAIYNFTNNSEMISAVLSNNQQLYYVFSIPKNIYFSKTEAIKKQIIVLTVLLLLFSILFSFLLSKRTYSPVRNIAYSAAVMLDKFGLKDTNSSKDDFKTINYTIEFLSGHVENLSKTLEKNIPLIKYNFYNSLINGFLHDNNEINSRIEFLKLPIIGQNYKVWLISPILDSLDIATNELVKVAIMKPIESLNSSTFNSYAMLAENNTVVIISDFDDEEEYNGVLNILDLELKDHSILKNIQYHISCGSCVNDIAQINLSYRQAKDILKYSYIYSKVVLDYNTLSDHDNNGADVYSLDIPKFKKLVNYLNLRLIEEFVDAFISDIRIKKLSYDYCRQLIMEILTTTFLYIKENNINNGKDIKKQALLNYYGTRSLEEFKSMYFELIHKLISCSDTQAENQNQELIIKIQEYIRANPGEDLSLKSLSDRFHISYSHLSKIFKETTSVNLSEFVSECRLNASLTLLLNTKLSIDDIAVQIGFYNTGYYIKNFKSFYGTTPKQYRIKQAQENV